MMMNQSTAAPEASKQADGTSVVIVVVVVLLLLDASGSTLFAYGQLHVPPGSVDINLALDGVPCPPAPDHVPDRGSQLLGPEAEGNLHPGDPLLVDLGVLRELRGCDAVVAEPHLVLEQVEPQVEVVLVLELEVERGGGLLEGEVVELDLLDVDVGLVWDGDLAGLLERDLDASDDGDVDEEDDADEVGDDAAGLDVLVGALDVVEDEGDGDLDGLLAVGVDGAGVGDEAGDELAAVAVDEVVDVDERDGDGVGVLDEHVDDEVGAVEADVRDVDAGDVGAGLAEPHDLLDLLADVVDEVLDLVDESAAALLVAAFLVLAAAVGHRGVLRRRHGLCSRQETKAKKER